MSATLNIPLVDDVLAVRLAGSMTARDGFEYNSLTKNRVNGRELWSGRVSARFEPSDNFRANFFWERFREDDNRSRASSEDGRVGKECVSTGRFGWEREH